MNKTNREKKLYKHRGILTIEMSILTFFLFFIMLLLCSLLYMVHIKESVRTALSEAAKSYSTEIYIASKLFKASGVDTVAGALRERASAELGFDVNPANLLSDVIFSSMLRARCYQKLGSSKGVKPPWMLRDMDIQTSATENSLYIKSRVPLKLPVLSLFKPDFELDIRVVEAARGAGVALSGSTKTESGKGDSDKELVICASSLSTKNKNPVYHDKKCFGRTFENKMTSLTVKNADITKGDDGKISYGGRVYSYCYFCSKNLIQKGKEDE